MNLSAGSRRERLSKNTNSFVFLGWSDQRTRERRRQPARHRPTSLPRPTFVQVARSPARLPTPATSSTPLQVSGAGITSLRIGATTPRLRLRQSTAGLMTTPASSQQRDESNEERSRTETITSLSQAISTGAIPRRLGLIREEVERKKESRIRIQRQKPSAESQEKESSEAEESRRAQRELELYVANSPVVPAAAPTPKGQTRVNSGEGPPTKKRRKNKKKKSKNPPHLTKEDYVLAYLSSSDDDEPGSTIRGFFGGVYSGTAEIDWDNWSPIRHQEKEDQTPEPNEDERRRGEEQQGEEERRRREEMEQREKEARERKEEERRAREEEQRLREARDNEKRLRAERAAAAAEERKRKSEKEKKEREEAERRHQEEQRTRDEAASTPVDQEQMETDLPASAATPENDMSREEAVAARNARCNAARAARRREPRRIQRE
ncbi:vicilin-like seed storage protein At2g18540 [Nasonia vitripennis]|uniref:Uncharacterized protein n=1 Tax=Nasonia vitripennis TaxID=7425 RepID=A0A7M7TEG7_NASVI|nr:vicilin-like seed storage protein At2g18540 [Nasonia vitripennis]